MGILNRGSRLGGLRRPASRGSRLGGTIARRPSSITRSPVRSSVRPITRSPVRSSVRSIARDSVKPSISRTPVRTPIRTIDRTPVRAPVRRTTSRIASARTPVSTRSSLRRNSLSSVERRKIDELNKEVKRLKISSQREKTISQLKKEREMKTSYYKEQGITDRKSLKMLEHLEAAVRLDGHDPETAKKIALEEFQSKLESADLNYEDIAQKTRVVRKGFGTTNMGIAGGAPAPKVEGKDEITDFQIKSLKLDQ